jgi:hypothetical protein
MAKRASSLPEELPRPTLFRPRDEAKRLLEEQIVKGRELAK